MKITLLPFAMEIIFLASGIFFGSCKKTGTATPPTVPTPVITSFSPTSDTIGASVAISGTNFSVVASENIVKFNGTSAVVSAAADKQLTAIVPLGVTTGPITVTVNGKTATSTNLFTPVGPSITSFTPLLSGIGYSVSIRGTNFSQDLMKDIVTINGVTAEVTAATTMLLTVTVPDGATTGKISVMVKGLQATSDSNITIRKLVVTTLAGTGNQGSDDGPGNAASFYSPEGIVIDANNNLYITDYANNKIRQITPDGVVSTFAGTGVSGTSNGPKTNAEFATPVGIALDKNGNFYISEGSGRNDIREISSSGIVSTIAGSPMGSAGYSDGTGSSALFSNPLGMAIGIDGNIYVVDNLNNVIRKVTPQGVVTTFAGSGTPGFNDGVGTAASFKSPGAITVDADGNFYISDQFGSRIRKMTASGEVTTVAGSGTVGFADGQGSEASFAGAAGIVKDQSGNLFIADSENGLIRMVTSSGYVGTLAGTQGMSTYSSNGTGASSVISNPFGIAEATDGTLYVVANGSSQILKITVQ